MPSPAPLRVLTWTRYALPLAGLIFILIIAPVFYTTALRDVFVLPKTLPLAFGTLLIWLALTWEGGVTFSRSLTPAIVALATATILSACFSVDMPLSLLGPHQQQFYAVVPLTLCLLAYYASANAEGMPPAIFVFLALMGGIAVAIPALTQAHGGGFQSWSIQNGRAGSTFGSPVFLGAYFALLLPMAWANRERVAFVAIAAGLWLTGSRGSMAAALSGILLIEHLRGNKISRIVGIILPAFVLIYFVGHHRDSDSSRVEIWRIALISWKAHPLLGWGPDTFELAFRQFMTQRFIDANGHNDVFIQLSAHNDILQVLTTMGLVGLAAYIFFYKEVASLLRRALGAETETFGIAGGITALFVNAKFNPIPLPVLVIASCLIGCLDRGNPYPEDDVEGSRPWARIALAASIILLVIFGTMSVAERHQRKGENAAQLGHMAEAAQEFNVAAQVNPFDLWYTQKQLDYFWTVIPRIPGVNKETLAAFSHNVSENIGRLHPFDPVAHEIRSISYRFEGNMIGHDRYWESAHEIEVAERLAPHFSAYVTQREEIAELMKKK